MFAGKLFQALSLHLEYLFLVETIQFCYPGLHCVLTAGQISDIMQIIIHARNACFRNSPSLHALQCLPILSLTSKVAAPTFKELTTNFMRERTCCSQHM
jgi:hypothetical protein